MQRVTPDIWNAFRTVETALRYTFLLDLVQGIVEGTPKQAVTCLPVKQAGLTLLYPTKTVPENWTKSCVITGHLVAALRGQEEFLTADHTAYM